MRLSFCHERGGLKVKVQSIDKADQGSPDYLITLYKRHFQGAIVRSGASVAMWLFALAAFIAGTIQEIHLTGITLAVIYLIAINPPTLFLLKRITSTTAYRHASLLINFLEIIGYTAIIYFRGGWEASFLTPIYAALITYVGMMAPWNSPYIIAGMCSAAFSCIVAFELSGFLPPPRVVASFNPPPMEIMIDSFVVIALLFVVAYVVALTEGILRKNRTKLHKQNLDLTAKSAELQKIQKNLKISHKVLENKVLERTSALNETNKKLRQEITDRIKNEEEKEKLKAQLQRAQKMEAIGTLAGGVAHDLNNVLSGIVSYPELLLMQLPQESPLRKPLSIIRKSGEMAAAIVDDLLTLARRGVVTKQIIHLNDVLMKYLKSPAVEALKSYHATLRIETRIARDLFKMEGSSVHLTKTIMNLVSNAAEAMPDGGTVLITTENRYVDSPILGYEHVEEGDYVVLSVSDTGTGIPLKDRHRIFEPFYTKKVMGKSGTGLGMSVVWGTVKDHGGYIDLWSEEGKGAVFTLFFPATREEFTAGKPVSTADAYKGKGESILVIDDSEEQREIASAILTQLGYPVNAVASGEEAVTYLKAAFADLLVLDMIMAPGMDGLDTYRKILEIHPGQKAIIASGFSETDRVREAQRLGAGQYMKKPYTMEKIGLAIRMELDR